MEVINISEYIWEEMNNILEEQKVVLLELYDKLAKKEVDIEKLNTRIVKLEEMWYAILDLINEYLRDNNLESADFFSDWGEWRGTNL